MTTEEYLKTVLTTEDEKSRASRILEALEGMSVYKAQELLKICNDATTVSPVRYTREANTS